jgi:hypothetical protein
MQNGRLPLPTNKLTSDTMEIDQARSIFTGMGKFSPRFIPVSVPFWFIFIPFWEYYKRLKNLFFG